MPIQYLRAFTNPERTDEANRRLGRSLAFVAGAANAGGFLAVGQYTSHMSGIVSSTADDLALGDLGLAGAGFASLVSFVTGAAVSAILINWGRRRALRSLYANLADGIVVLHPDGVIEFLNPAADRTAVINTPGGGASRSTRRPDLVPGVSPYIKDGGLIFLNPAAFSTPQPGTNGNLAPYRHFGKQASNSIGTPKKAAIFIASSRLGL